MKVTSGLKNSSADRSRCKSRAPPNVRLGLERWVIRGFAKRNFRIASGGSVRGALLQKCEGGITSAELFYPEPERSGDGRSQITFGNRSMRFYAPVMGGCEEFVGLKASSGRSRVPGSTKVGGHNRSAAQMDEVKWKKSNYCWQLR